MISTQVGQHKARRVEYQKEKRGSNSKKEYEKYYFDPKKKVYVV